MFLRCSFFVALLMIFVSCNTPSSENEPLFRALSPEQSGITFENTLQEGPNTNVLVYEYFYNGGGVAVADFDGDGWEDLYFTANMGDNKMYLNQGGLSFKDVTEVSQTAGRKGPWKTGVTTVDINGDNRMDIYVCYSGMLPKNKRRNQLFLNMGNNENGIPTFVDAAKLYGIDASGYSNQGFFFDYDQDNDLDLLLMNHNPKSLPVLNEARSKQLLKIDDSNAGLRLFKQENNRFVDVTQSVGLVGSGLSYGLGIALADYNKDGWIDFYICNDYSVPDYLYLNKQGQFENALQKSMAHTSHFSMGNDAGDINNDGWIDLITLDMLPEDNKRQKLLRAPDNYNQYDLNLKSGFHHQIMRNMVQLNNGNGTFSEIGQLMGVSNTDWSWAPLLADFDNDGWNDLMITNGYRRDYTNRDFLNYMETFIAEKKSAMSREDVVDIIKEMPASNVSNYIFKNINGSRFENKTNEWGLQEQRNSNGAAYADFDKDGDLDIVINHIDQPATVYENQGISTNHYVTIELNGDGKNKQALGAEISLFANGIQQTKTHLPARGYLSTVSQRTHFGLGSATQIDSIIVQWPHGKTSVHYNLNSDRLIALSPENKVFHHEQKKIQPLLKKVPSSLSHTITPPTVLDFDRQPLLHYQPSFEGPKMIAADVNNDGLEDILIGGSQKQASALWIQNKQGDFIQKPQPAFKKNQAKVTTDITLLDADADGDLDVFAAHGGYHLLKENDSQLQDQLYLNDGNGTFLPTKGLPKDRMVTAATATADFNGDGLPDVFLAGGIIPGKYPRRYANKVLINQGKATFKAHKSWNTKGIDDHPGIIRHVITDDFNADGKPDLLAVGEWMEPLLWLNNEEHFVLDTTGIIANNTPLFGWWNTIQKADLNGDGKTDYVLGNEGLNTQYQASAEEPITLQFDDFDKNGMLDPILSCYVQGVSYPTATRDELLAQWVELKSVYTSYEAFSQATSDDLIPPHENKTTQKWKANEMRSMVLMHEKGQWVPKPLPRESQFSPVRTILAKDFDGDGHQDLVLAGNRMHMALKFGRSDALIGTVLKGDGAGNLITVSPLEHGLNLPYETPSAVQIHNQIHFLTVENGIITYQKTNRK